MERSTDNRAQALRKAHEAAAYNEWLAAEIQEAVDDPRPNLSHDEVMALIEADVAAPTAARKPAAKKRA